MSKDKCPKCGNKMQIYYILKCFHCTKPTPKKGRGNLLEAMYWLLNNDKMFSKDKLWDHLCNIDKIRGNDTWIELEEDDDPMMIIFCKHFKTNGILWKVSW